MLEDMKKAVLDPILRKGMEEAMKMEEVKKVMADLSGLKKYAVMGLQVYEFLENNANEIKEDFIAGRVNLPTFSYPRLDVDAKDFLVEEERELRDAEEELNVIDKYYRNNIYPKISEDEVSKIGGAINAVRTLIFHREEEIRMIKAMKRIYDASRGVLNLTPGLDYNKMSEGFTVDYCSMINCKNDIGRLVHYNKSLYGGTKESVVFMLLREILSDVDEDSVGYDPAIFNEAMDGIKRFFGKDSVKRLETSQKMPRLGDDVARWLYDYVEGRFGLDRIIKNDFLDISSEVTDVKQGGFEADDIKALFDLVIFGIETDANTRLGIEIELDENGKNLSFDNESGKIKIGVKRSSIKNLDIAKGKIAHELIVHGMRYVYSLRSGLELLGFGVYLKGSYLSFEEGLASLLERIYKSGGPEKLKSDKEWDMGNMSTYLSLALAERGASFREAYELMWRLRAIFMMKKSVLNHEKIAKQKSLAYTYTNRVYRGGVPSYNPDGNCKSVYFAKDIVYIDGKIKVIDYLRKAFESKNISMLDDMFLGKFDPTNVEHMNLAKSLGLK